jgi:hypothetical protein
VKKSGAKKVGPRKAARSKRQEAARIAGVEAEQRAVYENPQRIPSTANRPMANWGAFKRGDLWFVEQAWGLATVQMGYKTTEGNMSRMFSVWAFRDEVAALAVAGMLDVVEFIEYRTQRE